MVNLRATGSGHAHQIPPQLFCDVDDADQLSDISLPPPAEAEELWDATQPLPTPFRASEGARTVFMSYRVNDSAFVRRLAQRLKNDGFNILPEPVKRARPLAEDIECDIERSDIFCIFISSAWYENQLQLKAQLSHALHRMRHSEGGPHIVIPVILDDGPVPNALAHLACVRKSGRNLYRRLRRQLTL